MLPSKPSGVAAVGGGAPKEGVGLFQTGEGGRGRPSGRTATFPESAGSFAALQLGVPDEAPGGAAGSHFSNRQTTFSSFWGCSEKPKQV